MQNYYYDPNQANQQFNNPPQMNFDPYTGRPLNQPPTQPMYDEGYYKRKEVKREIRTIGYWLGGACIAYLVIQTIFALYLKRSGLYSAYQNDSIAFNALTILGVSFASLLVPFSIVGLCNKNKYKSNLIPRDPISVKECILWVFSGMLCCMLSDYLIVFITAFAKVLGYKLSGASDTPDANSVLACILAFIGTAMVPAICEELSLRCFGMGLLKKYGKGFAILAISIVFGLLHGNIIQFIFAFVVGLILAYITIKTNNIIPAMIIHMCNNGISVVGEISNYFFKDDKITNAISGTIMVLWMGLGAISLIILFNNKKITFKDLKEEGSEWMPSLSSKLASLIPGLILPFAILIYLTSQTITKI